MSLFGHINYDSKLWQFEGEMDLSKIREKYKAVAGTV